MSEKWRTVPLSEIADINPRLGKTALSDDSLYTFVPMASVGASDGIIDVSAKRPYAEVKKGFTPFQSSDVLFAKITPCMENGKMAVVPHLENQYGFGSTEFHVIRLKDGNDPKYVYYYVSGQGFRKEAAHNMTGAVGQKRVPTDFLKQSPIPLPPTIEDQKKIVAEIEKQFSRLDEAVASLKRIQANLKRYKAAVLKAAVEGKLTEHWRKDHPDVEPADQLLKRILAERRAKWEAEELAKIKTKGTKPKDDSWKKKYKEPVGPDTANLPELPGGWVWAIVEQIADIMLGKMLDKAKHLSGNKLPYLRNVNVRWGQIATEDLFEMFFEGTQLERYGLIGGDVLVCEGGEPGRAAVWNGKFPEMKYQKALHRVRCSKEYEPRMLVILLEHLAKSGRLEKWFTGSTIKHFTRESFVQLPVPLPSFLEQKVILDEIDRRLSVTEELETTIKTNLKRAERLRQTILQRAFSGGLV